MKTSDTSVYIRLPTNGALSASRAPSAIAGALDSRFQQLSSPASGTVSTPDLDKMASERMRFTKAHSGSADCSPSRRGLLAAFAKAPLTLIEKRARRLHTGRVLCAPFHE
jgi:hypothetical protein